MLASNLLIYIVNHRSDCNFLKKQIPMYMSVLIIFLGQKIHISYMIRAHSILHIIQLWISLGHKVINYSPVFSTMHHKPENWDHCKIIIVTKQHFMIQNKTDSDVKSANILLKIKTNDIKMTMPHYIATYCSRTYLWLCC